MKASLWREAGHKNIEQNPVFRGMAGGKPLVCNQRKL